jgi:hypothetical protein
MIRSVTRLLPEAVYAALVVVPMIAPAKATTNDREDQRALERIQKNPAFSDRRSSGQARPVTPPSSQAERTCAGSARSYDCKQWPPSIDEDPDRKTGGGGGM